MGKLVVGILAVVLVQIAFFGYTSIYWSTQSGVELAASTSTGTRKIITSPLPPTKDLVKPAEAEAEPAEDVSLPSAVKKDRLRKSRATDDRSRALRSPVRKVATYRRPREVEVAQSRLEHPRRYSVVLEDRITLSLPSPHADPPKQKKRSLFAKSFNVVIKKPWGWMRSLASKLK